MTGGIDVAVAEGWAAVARARQEWDSSPESVDRLVARLLAVADTCLSVTRDGDLEITSPAQFAVCEEVAEALAELEPADPDLARRARGLIDLVEAGGAFRWSKPVRAAALGAVAAAVAFGGATAGGLTDDVVLVIVSALLGSGLLFATIRDARRPVWRLHADLIAPMVRRHGL